MKAKPAPLPNVNIDKGVKDYSKEAFVQKKLALAHKLLRQVGKLPAEKQ